MTTSLPERWRSPTNGVAGLDGLTVKTHCLSGYCHYPPPQSPAQLSQIYSVGFLSLTILDLLPTYLPTIIYTYLNIIRIKDNNFRSMHSKPDKDWSNILIPAQCICDYLILATYSNPSSKPLSYSVTPPPNTDM